MPNPSVESGLGRGQSLELPQRSLEELEFLPIYSWVNWDVVERAPKLADRATELINRLVAGESVSEDIRAKRSLFDPFGRRSQRDGDELSQLIYSAIADLKGYVPRQDRDPDYETNPHRDVAAYISGWSSRYTHYVSQLARQIPPIDPRCRTSLTVPVAAHEEGRYALDTLDAFRRQIEEPAQYEIVLFLNCPGDCEPGEMERVAALSREIDQYTVQNPERRIFCIRGSLHGPRVQTISFICSVLSDAVLFRAAQATLLHDLILLRCDADTRATTDRFVENFRFCFDSSPHVDAFVGRLRWSPEHTVVSPLSLVNQRLTELSDEIRRHFGDLPSVGGPALAIRSSVFAAIGGYSVTKSLGEDIELSRSLLNFRAGSKKFTPVEDAGPASRLYTSARRADAALHFQNPISHQWREYETSFGTRNSEIRVPDPAVSLAPHVKDNMDLRNSIEIIINRTVDALPNRSDGNENAILDKLIEFGIDYHLGINLCKRDGGGWSVTDISRFLAQYEIYKSDGLNRWKQSLRR